MDFEILILGTDINAYYMARCYHEKYHKKANLIGRTPMSYTKYSNIINIEYDKDIWSEKGFLNALELFRKNHPNRTILLISCNETYTNFISKNKKKINKNYVFSYPDIDLIETLSNKEKFYKTYKDSILDFPKTIYYKNNDKIPTDNRYPLIIKPADVTSYNHLSFEKKIYKVNNTDELVSSINKIREIGYTDTLIIQDYIKGDDSYLLDVVVYCDRNKKVKLISSAAIGLQEHSKRTVGNAAVLITNYVNYGDTKEILTKIEKFMNKINYQGFAEIDLKYDIVDKKYKVLEINPRQGRCNYYLNELGYNLIEVLVEDLVYKKDLNLPKTNKQIVLSFVPRSVVVKYIKNDKFRNKVLKLWHTKASPLEYKKDINLKRKLFIMKRKYMYNDEYKNSDWINE